ncbi:MAG: C-terminal processing peptidase-3 [Bryobacterales bacterium]|nr:C-terminal processing peptidase-3 [Bryobacterales bacterium]
MRRFALICVCLRPLLAADDPAQLERELKKIISVYAAVESESADPIPADAAIYQGAIPGMLRTLDPHSVFFDPDQFEQLKQMQASERKGFGTVVSLLPGRLIVLQTLEGSPSAKAGLSAGDEILAINTIPIRYLDVDQLTQLLGEARQHDATLDVRKPGSERPVQMVMSPALLDAPTVDRAYMVAPGIGHLRITSFEEPTGRLVKQTIEKLGGEYLKGLIIDLRDNPGGAVQTAAETAALFLSPDQVIFSIRGRTTKPEEVAVPKDSTPYTLPVVILINSKSASASEIVTGALQDHDRAIVLGEPSFGKGLVQQVFPLSASSGLALTTAFYYTPSGRSIQKPLASGQLGAATVVARGPFRSDAGRSLPGGGGIQPDQIVYPAQQSRLQVVLDATGSLTSFAGEFLRTHSVSEDGEVTPAMLDELKVFLSERSIQPSVTDWLSHSDWIASRLQQEILTLKFGVARGDEIELKRDPAIQTALRKLRGAP